MPNLDLCMMEAFSQVSRVNIRRYVSGSFSDLRITYLSGSWRTTGQTFIYSEILAVLSRHLNQTFITINAHQDNPVIWC
jgi:hypothetical protein